MLLIVELVMLIAGIWAIVAGKLPSFLFGGPKYRFEGRGVRWLGLILLLPLPMAFVGGVVLALLFGDQSSDYALLLELVIVLAAAIAVLIVSRFVRQPATTPSGGEAADDLSKVEARIARKAQGSLIYALLGILGFSAILVCPLAFMRANQALRLIDEHHVGEQYRRTAHAARIIAPAIFLFYAAIVAIFVAIGLIGK